MPEVMFIAEWITFLYRKNLLSLFIHIEEENEALAIRSMLVPRLIVCLTFVGIYNIFCDMKPRKLT
jgi:hypothetical protein